MPPEEVRELAKRFVYVSDFFYGTEALRTDIVKLREAAMYVKEWVAGGLVFTWADDVHRALFPRCTPRCTPPTWCTTNMGPRDTKILEDALADYRGKSLPFIGVLVGLYRKLPRCRITIDAVCGAVRLIHLGFFSPDRARMTPEMREAWDHDLQDLIKCFIFMGVEKRRDERYFAEMERIRREFQV